MKPLLHHICYSFNRGFIPPPSLTQFSSSTVFSHSVAVPQTCSCSKTGLASAQLKEPLLEHLQLLKFTFTKKNLILFSVCLEKSNSNNAAANRSSLVSSQDFVNVKRLRRWGFVPEKTVTFTLLFFVYKWREREARGERSTLVSVLCQHSLRRGLTAGKRDDSAVNWSSNAWTMWRLLGNLTLILTMCHKKIIWCSTVLIICYL